LGKANLQRHGIFQLDARLSGVRRRSDGSWFLGDFTSAIRVGDVRTGILAGHVSEEEWEGLHSGVVETTVVAVFRDIIERSDNSSLSPEILNAVHTYSERADPTTVLPFSKQAVFEWGVTVGRALLGGSHPLGDTYDPPSRDHPVSPYDTDTVALPPSSLAALVRQALAFDRATRPSMRELLEALSNS
jgi:hypothetical protein